MPPEIITNTSFDNLERARFLYDAEGNVAVRVDARGTFSVSGLNVEIKTTTMNVGTTAVKLPATPLSGRNSISIYNLSETDILYIGKSDVTADRAIGTTAGFEIPPEGIWNIDITDAIEIYGRTASFTIKVIVTEIV